VDKWCEFEVCGSHNYSLHWVTLDNLAMLIAKSHIGLSFIYDISDTEIAAVPGVYGEW